jgi:hypothetical protein
MIANLDDLVRTEVKLGTYNVVRVMGKLMGRYLDQTRPKNAYYRCVLCPMIKT